MTVAFAALATGSLKLLLDPFTHDLGLVRFLRRGEPGNGMLEEAAEESPPEYLPYEEFFVPR